MTDTSTSSACGRLTESKVRIGLDFDNTLACYDAVFTQEAQKLGFISYAEDITKQEIKARLLSRPNGSRLWQTLQGRVYGPSMANAHLFPGVASFLLRSLQRGDELFIVSHKTEFGHFDPTQTSLRQAAMDWMECQGFFDPRRFCLLKEHVFFAHTREEKISRIASLNLDVFIDDLEDVFIQECFPSIEKILFNTHSHSDCADTRLESWAAIAEHILGPLTNKDAKVLAQTICPESIRTVHQLEQSGNSILYRVESVSDTRYALKCYPALILDSRPRLKVEVMALELLDQYELTPRVVNHNQDLNIALFDWIDGKTPELITKSHISQALHFIQKLKNHGEKNCSDLPLASEACLSANELFTQVETRIIDLKTTNNSAVVNFLQNSLEPLWKNTRTWSTAQWPKYNLDTALPPSKQVLSPSDFGFHNTLALGNQPLV